MALTLEQLYALALVDFHTSVGKIFVTKELMSYGDTEAEDKPFFFKDGVRVRIMQPDPDPRIPYNGLFHPQLVDGWLDPYWPVEVLDQRDELIGYTNFYVFPRSFNEYGMIIGTDNLLSTF